ncbi:MAG: hypothetical protein HN909_02975 [Phycisphaerales bacterium]|nr:hypothetical protein [Phycisphaerales bacterium]
MMRGSGGRNRTASNPYAGSTHLSSVGEMRGLSSFRGGLSSLNGNLATPYGGNTLAVSLFRKQSVSLGDVLQGNLYNTSRPYDDPLRRTVNANAATQASLIGQLPSPKNVSHVDRIASQLYAGALTDSRFAPIGDVRERNNLATNPFLANNMGLRVDGNTHWRDRAIRRMDLQDRMSRGGDQIFGVIHGEDREQLAAEFEALEGSTPEFQEAIDTKIEGGVDPALDATADKPVVKAGSGLAVAEDLAMPGSSSPLSRPKPTAENGVLPNEDQDVFVDLLVNLNKKSKADEQAPPEPAMSDTLLKEEMILRQKRIERHRKANDARRKLGELPAVEYNTKTREVVIHNLAGKGGDLFNQYMQRGAKYLKDRYYYKAARQYDLATLVRPQNPLASLGRSVSSLAAGEWLTSAQHLERALTLFPPLMESTLDMDAMIDRKTYGQRMAALDRWRKALGVSPPLMLLQMFCHANNREMDKARAVAKELIAADKKRIETLAQLQDRPEYPQKLATHVASYQLAKKYAEYLLEEKAAAPKPKGIDKK